MENIVIRRETLADCREVEEMIREAFWNLYVPGCLEHYVAHVIRQHEDFIPELDLVLEKNGTLIGNIMYTKAWLADGKGCQKTILTFGPVCIRPGLQRKGYGRRLIEESMKRAADMGYEAVVIFGNPGNYVGLGFQSCKKYNVSLEGGGFPAAMLVKELRLGALQDRAWIYRQSPAMAIDEEAGWEFDRGFEKKEKAFQPSQEEFYIHSHAFIQEQDIL